MPNALGEIRDATYIKGQQEIGTSGFRHWQIICYFQKKRTVTATKTQFCVEAHVEPSRSSAVEAYVWKSETKVAGTEFEFGERPLKRNSKTDWDRVLSNAKKNNLEDIPSDIFIRSYSTLNRIGVDFAQPVLRTPQKVIVLWGPSGSGKSHWAFENAGDDYYIKAPLTKWWDGYRGQKTILIDEFRGVIDVSHFLKWVDKYPCAVEKKGSQVYLETTTWYITSNLHPDSWWPTLDDATQQAVKRRITTIIHKMNAFEVMMAANQL